MTILLEAEKSLDQVQNQHVLLIEEVEQELEVLTKKQTDGWKINTIQDLSGTLIQCFKVFCKIITTRCNRLVMMC